MTKKKPLLSGAIRAAAKLRANALIRYYQEVRCCKNCGVLLEVKTEEKPIATRQRTFCSTECRESYFSEGDTKRHPLEIVSSRNQQSKQKKSNGSKYVFEETGKCETCGVKVIYKPTNREGRYSYRKYCEECLVRFFKELHKDCPGALKKPIEEFTKRELLNLKGYTRYKGFVGKHANKVYKASEKPKVCVVCGYSKSVQVCHIKDIASFDNETLIGIINTINNLTTLCPTHHHEFDKQLKGRGNNYSIEEARDLLEDLIKQFKDTKVLTVGS